jgi:hypothetical protein
MDSVSGRKMKDRETLILDLLLLLSIFYLVYFQLPQAEILSKFNRMSLDVNEKVRKFR